jgi:tight adherence protein B
MLGAGVLLAGGWLLAGPLLGALLAAAGPLAVSRLVAWRRRRWRIDLAAGAPAVARALADALAGGHGLRRALDEVARRGGLTGPAAVELEDVARRLALGAPTAEVLERVRERAASPPWDALVAAIRLQHGMGGDLTALLRSLAEAQEHARQVEAEARGLTAQARATARLVGGLPFAGLALAELARPGTLGGLLEDPRSRVLLLASMALGTLAFWVVGRLARVGDG